MLKYTLKKTKNNDFLGPLKYALVRNIFQYLTRIHNMSQK